MTARRSRWLSEAELFAGWDEGGEESRLLSRPGQPRIQGQCGLVWHWSVLGWLSVNLPLRPRNSKKLLVMGFGVLKGGLQHRFHIKA